MTKKIGTKLTTQQTLNVLLTGKGKEARQFAGKHVLVVKGHIEPLGSGTESKKTFRELTRKYGESPVVVYVPREDVSYILFV